MITFWSGIAAGDIPAGPLIFCTCAGIRDPAGPRPAPDPDLPAPPPSGAGQGR